MKRKPSYREREAAAKRARAIKASLIAKATMIIEGLWVAANAPDSTFSAADRKAIADASYSIRSVRGGWLNRRSL